MPKANPNSFKGGGGKLRDVDGVITGIQFTDIFPPTGKTTEFKDGGRALYGVISVLQDGADTPVEEPLFVGNAEQYEVVNDGRAVSGEAAFSKSSAWYIFLNALVEAGYPAENFGDDPLVADYSCLIGARCHFNWQKNEKATEKYGQTKSKKTGRSYDREDLIVTAFHGMADLKKSGKPAAAKSTASTTTKTVAKGGKSNGAAAEVDIKQLTTDRVTAIVAAAKGQSITKSKLSVKLLGVSNDAKDSLDVRNEMRELAFNDEFLGNIAGLDYDPATETLSA